MSSPKKIPETIVDLRPVGMYDTGLSVLRPDVNSAVEAMVVTGATVCVYEQRTLMALYKNVSRRNERLPKDAPAIKLWSHRTADPQGEFPARWQLCVRTDSSLFNPFFSTEQSEQYGRWLPLTERLMTGEIVTVDSVAEVIALGQSFRLACDSRGYARRGRMLRRKKVGRRFEVRLAVPLGEPTLPVKKRGPRPKKRKTVAAAKRPPAKAKRRKRA